MISDDDEFGTIPDDGSDSIIDDESGSIPHDPLTRKLYIPPIFRYKCFNQMRELKRALGSTTGTDDVLVVLNEYENLYQALEGDYKDATAIVVTGHPGIGSYQSWFQSQVKY